MLRDQSGLTVLVPNWVGGAYISSAAFLSRRRTRQNLDWLSHYKLVRNGQTGAVTGFLLIFSLNLFSSRLSRRIVSSRLSRSTSHALYHTSSGMITLTANFITSSINHDLNQGLDILHRDILPPLPCQGHRTGDNILDLHHQLA